MVDRLNQVIAVEKDAKTRAYSTLTEYNKLALKPDLFNGFSKVYRPKDEQGEHYPPEQKRVQFRVGAFFKEIRSLYEEWLDLAASKDLTNQKATAPVVVEGVEVLPAVPATFLLGIEKVLADLKTFVSNLPELPGDETWRASETDGLFVSEPVQVHRTKKIQKALVLHPPTVEHPAQTAQITEDEIVGYWTVVKNSSTISWTQKQEILERIVKLAAAVKKAREQANMTEAVEAKIGRSVLTYVFGV